MTYAVKASRDSIRIRVVPEITWREETWRLVHSMGEGPSVMHSKAQAGTPDYAYDARQLPPEAEAELAILDAAVKSAIAARDEWLSAHFRTWPVVGPHNATKVIPGHPKAEAMAQLKAAPKPTAAALKAQQKMLSNLNRALNS